MEGEFTTEPTPPSEPTPASGETLPPATVASAPPPPTPGLPPQPDRTTGLVIFGVIQIILGLMAALMVPLLALGAFMSRLAPGGSMRPGQFLSTTSTYVFLAATLIGLGIGSVRAKRWARALTLVTSWYWLAVGLLVTVLLTAMLPVALRSAMQAQPNGAGAPPAPVSTAVMAVVITLIIVFCAFFLVVVPIAFIVFYSRMDVAATCRYRDPGESWTDRSPLPVLFASMVCVLGALYLLVTGVSTPVFPFFGRYLTGIAGSACFLAVAALDAYLSVALFRLRPAGWWIAIVTVPVRLLSMAITYARADLMQAYSKMGMSEAQLQMLRTSPLFRGHVILWWSLLSLIIFFGYLVWLKRYFKTSPALPAETLPQTG